MDLIITHKKCPDGWCAAFIAKKRYPEAKILALDHGEEAPFNHVRNRDVLVLDFSWPIREDNIKLRQLAKSLWIFDHHKSALERIGDLPFVTFDMKRSGAGLTWDYLFGKDAMPGPENPRNWGLSRPWYVNFVEDRDLWNWALPGSKAVNAFIGTLPFTIEDWKYLDIIKVEQAEQLGISVLRYIDKYVKEAVLETQFGTLKMPWGSYTTGVLNVPYMNCSEIGNVIAETAEVSLTWFERTDGMYQVSLRSIGDIDVSRIAKHYLGGGHRNAAGFRLPVAEGRKLLDLILGRDSD